MNIMRYQLLGLFLLGNLLLSSPVAAQDIDFTNYNLSGWGIQNFHSDIVINQDSSFTVTEKITADFTRADNKHGIKRFIPIRYKDAYNQNLNLHFNLISVKDENNKDIETETTYSGNDITLKIGSANVYVDGKIKTYQITYQLDRGLNQFTDHDELYWNVTGNGFDTAIVNASSTVTLPTLSDQKKLKAICYTGSGYSKEKDCQAKVIDGKTYQFKNNSLLPANSGLTIVVAFPKGLISYPNLLTYTQWFLLDNWGYLLPIITFLFIFYRWHKYGRDPKAMRATIMPEYEAPENLSPAEVGTLLDDQVDMHDITSTIIDLATRGYLKIIETEKKNLVWTNYEYQLEKTTPKNTVEALKDFESLIYESIFGEKEKINLEDLKYKFYKDIPKIKKAIYKNLVDKKYYPEDPDHVRGIYLSIGFIGGLLCFMFLTPLIDINLPLFIGLLASCAIIFAFAKIMPKKSQKGVDTHIRILGLEEFIKTAEKDRLKFYEKENIFEKMLPYAIALGIADKWAKACEGIFKQAPDWYQSSNPNMISHFNTYHFLNTLNSFNNTMSTNMQSAPRSSASGGSSGFGGGGFSGGGFGGGGGSSW
jgi:hypothetical protein